jgi:hypothetical protein
VNAAAKWIADTLGDIEIERLRESRSNTRGGQQSYGLERQVEPLVMASEISGLAALRGYLKMGNLVVRLSFPFVHLPKKAPAFIERRHHAVRQGDPTRPAVITHTPAVETTESDRMRAVEPPCLDVGYAHNLPLDD